MEELFHGPPGPVPVGSDVEDEWKTDLDDSENEGNSIKITYVHRVAVVAEKAQSEDLAN